MILLVRLIALILIGVGTVLLVRPGRMVRMVVFWERGKRIYLAGLLRLVFGLVLLFGASECTVPNVVTAFGLLFLLGGLLIFILGPEKSKALMHRWMDQKSDGFRRLLAGVTLAIGITVFFAA